MKVLLLFSFVTLFFIPIVFSQELTEIKGFAPSYIGKQIDLYETMDYISMRPSRIASTTVGEDSTFTFSFYLKETQKLHIVSQNNKGTFFAQPGARYEVFFPERNKYEIYNPAGNFVEIPLINLPKEDINYKILEFNRWNDEFLARYYTKHNAETQYFVAKLDTFRTNVEAYYQSDTTDPYPLFHRRYSFAKTDDLRFLGARNKYEKYDFYLRHAPVYYQNEAYMDYVKSYYDQFLPRIDSKINNEVYLALLKSSPTLIFNALGKEYTLKENYQLRELVMIYILSQAFNEKDMPQTNILSVLDSLEQRCLFPTNRLIAENVKFRLEELTQGSKAPDFFIKDGTSGITLQNFKGKHLYLFFIDPNNIENQKELKVLTGIYERYKDNVNFLMLVKQSAIENDLVLQKLQNDFPWKIVAVPDENSIFSKYQVLRFPYYVLLDGFGYVVGAPALGPTPNGSYDTIDKIFFLIQKAQKEGNGTDR